MAGIIRTTVQTHTKVDQKIWKRISSWLKWDDISISGDKLTLTIKFGEVGVALRAFRYYTTGSDPHGERSGTH